jgi:lipopolysaccharide transport system ATP-binding protein
MHLRAEHVSLFFPAPNTAAATLDTRRSNARLGGARVMFRGKPCIRALDDVSVSLNRGDRLGVIGHNGSGKSTLLRTLAGLYIPHQGTVTASAPVSGIFNMSIGFRQEATGYRNIVLKGLMAGRSKREIDAAIPEIVEFTGLGPYLEMPLATYSQGMALRLAFAITTAFAHDVLVMDEWIGAGDAQFQERVVARMNSVLEATHICVLASHNKTLLNRMTERCIWMEDGRVRLEGDTAEVIARYDSETRELLAATEAASSAPRLPIPPSYTVLEVLPPARPNSSAVRLRWNLEPFNVSKVRLTVYNTARDEEQLVCTAQSRGERPTGEWVRPGMEFRLYDGLGDSLLGTVTIEPNHLERQARASGGAG